MNPSSKNFIRPGSYLFLTILFLLTLSSCRSSREVVQETEDFSEAETEARQITERIPNYSKSLTSISGRGKAIVSEPGTSDRVNVIFSSNHQKSLVAVKNGIGVEGGQILSDGDSLLVYNKIDKFARKISIREGELRRINNLASLNILDLINFTVDTDQIRQVRENENHYRLQLNNGARVFVDKDSGFIIKVEQPRSSGLPYSQIQYDAYSKIEGFMLPRRITIFSADKQSKVNLLVQSLEINPRLDELKIELPENITIYYR